MKRTPILVLALLLAVAASGLAQPGSSRVQPQWLGPRAAAPDAGALEEVVANARDAAARVETASGGIGSGFLISSDGLVMTAYHVVRGGASLAVVLADGRRRPARLVGFDAYADMALLDIAGHGYPSLPIDLQDVPSAGDAVVAIGNSRGQFLAARAGRVLAIDQTLAAGFPSQLIASDMPLAPGDSGGPVLDSDGEVVGVAVAVSVGPEGTSSFATPLFGRAAGEAVEALQSGLHRGVPFIGVSLIELDAQAVAELGFGRAGGLLVTEVVPGSGAASAGILGAVTTGAPGRNGRGDGRGAIEQADVIVALDGHAIAGHDDLVGLLRGSQVGDVVTVTILRGGERIELQVTLGTRTL